LVCSLLNMVLIRRLTTGFIPKVVGECLVLLLRLRDIPASNLSPETGYPEVPSSFRECVRANATIP
jgi:hypothetical protein